MINKTIKIPPQNIELEQSILSSCILNPDDLEFAVEFLKSQDFYRISHRYIFKAMTELNNRGKPIDLITLLERLRENGRAEDIGGSAYLAGLLDDAPITSNIEQYCEILKNLAVKRRVCVDSLEIHKLCFDDTVGSVEILNKAQQMVSANENDVLNQEPVRAGDLLPDLMDRYVRVNRSVNGITGLETKFTRLDKMTGGLQNTDLLVLAARPGMGKCFGKGTKILMYSGDIKPVEEIKVGDVLMGDDSGPRKVVSLARGREAMYWVRQKKAMDYRVNESHILSLKRSRNGKGVKNGDNLNIPLLDYLSKSKKYKSNYKGYKVSVEFKEKILPICPYFLGIWLGDGRSGAVGISTTDIEAINYLKEYADSLGLLFKKTIGKDKNGKDKCPTISITSVMRGNHQNISSLQEELRKLLLIKNKHIPKIYLTSSRKQRLELLAGLIDSDGYYIRKHKRYEITQKNYTLAKHIKFLCDSLGFRTSLIKKTASIKKINYSYDVYKVRFSGDIDQIPVLIKYKKAEKPVNRRKFNQTGISIKYDKVDDYYGFVCDKNHLFLLEDMTVVHNTAFALDLARSFIEDLSPVLFVSFEMPNDQITTRMVSKISGVDQRKFRVGGILPKEWEKISIAMDRMNMMPFFIDSPKDSDFDGIKRKIRRAKRSLGIKVVMIDYLQLMVKRGDFNRRKDLEIGAMTRELKLLAKELNIPILLLSQLNRNVEGRNDKRPVLSDLRESGNIEQDSDIVMFLYRDEVYNSDPNNENKGIGELDVQKHRNGPTGMVKLQWDGKTATFRNFYYGQEK